MHSCLQSLQSSLEHETVSKSNSPYLVQKEKMKRSFNVPFKNFSKVFPNVAYVLPGWNTLSNSMLNHMTETSLSISCCGRWAISSLLQELVKDPVELGGSNPVFLISINFSSYQLKFRKPFHNRLTSSGETRFFGIGGETSFFV